MAPSLRIGRRKEAFAAPRFQLRLQIFPQLRTTTLDLRAHPLDDPLVAHPVLQPASASVGEVQKDGHAAIDGLGKASLIRFSRIKLFP